MNFFVAICWNRIAAPATGQRFFASKYPMLATVVKIRIE